MTARIRGQQAVPSEESPSQFKFRILTALGKLDDRDAHGRASDELKQAIDELTPEQLLVVLGCIHDALAKVGSATAKREHVRLFAVLCSVHGDDMAPHLPKAIAVILKILKEGDAQSVEVCVDALALMSKTVPASAASIWFASPSESPFPLCVFLSPLFKLLADQTKLPQIGAALTLARILEANYRVIPSLLHHIVPPILRFLSSPHFHASARLLVAIQHCIQGAREGMLEYVPSLMELVLSLARSKQWTDRKAAFDVLRVLAQCLGAAMNSYRDDVLRLLNELRYDRIRSVREAIVGAQVCYQELGASLSPTKVSLHAEERTIKAHPHAIARAGLRPSPSPSVSSLRSPGPSPLHSHSTSPVTSTSRPRASQARVSTAKSVSTSSTSLPVQLVPSSPSPTISLADLARTVHEMQLQQNAFMSEVRAHLESFDRRLHALESRVSPGSAVRDAPESEDEVTLVARIAELEREELEAAEETGEAEADGAELGD